MDRGSSAWAVRKATERLFDFVIAQSCNPPNPQLRSRAVGLLERLFGRQAAPGPVQGPPPSYPQQVPYLDGLTVLGLSAVWRCVTLIADAIADWPWREFAGTVREPRELEPSRLVRRPAALMNRREWTWRVVATEALYNAAHLLHVGGTDSEGVPWSLLPVPPQAIYPAHEPDPYGMLPPTEYVVGDRLVSASFLTVVRRAPFPGATDRVLPLIDLARREFQTFLAASVHSSRYWFAGGPTVTQITSDQALTDPEAEAIAKRWQERRSMGSDYPAVMGKGAKAEPWGADPTAESAVDARREMLADVARYFGVPTRIVNAPAGDSETYANVDDDAIDLERYTLRGYAGPLEEAISELLPGSYITGRRIRLDSTAWTRGNLHTRAQALPALVQGDRPILTVPEARAIGFGLGPIPADEQPAPPAAAEAIPAAFGSAFQEV